MRLLFVYDHHFVRAPSGVVHSRGPLGASVWQRYLEVFDELAVAARVHEVDSPDAVRGLPVSSADRVSFVPVPNISHPVSAFANRRAAAAVLRRAIAEVDVVLVRLPSEIGLLAAHLADQAGRPWAAEVVGCPLDGFWYHGAAIARAYAPFAWMRMRRAVRRSPMALYVTERFLQMRYPTQGWGFACSDVEIDTPDPALLARRLARTGERTGPLRMGLIGSLNVQYKGLDTALAALARVRAEGVAAELHVLGGGDQTRWIALASRLGVRDALCLHGTLPTGAAVWAWLDTLDVFLQPSRQEGLPRALVEAMSRGLPAFGSIAGGIPELLPPEVLVPAGDERGLAGLIRHAANDPAWLASLSEANHRQAARYARDQLDRRRRTFMSALTDSARGKVPGAPG